MKLLMLYHAFSLEEPVIFELFCTELLSAERTLSLCYFSSKMCSEYLASKQLKNLFCTFFFQYFNSGDAL